jgi:acetoin utilization deacetylase AcuC-like enzyme
VSDTQKFITSLILVNVGFDFAGADSIVMFKVSVKFYWQLQGYILFKAAGALAVCFLGCFKYCLS